MNARSDRHGKTALINAITSQHVAMVKLLLEEGRTLEMRDIERESELRLAARLGRPAMVQPLLFAGTKIDAAYSVWMTTLVVAEHKRNELIFEKS